MKAGNTSYKSTALGGCTVIERCNKRMLRQLSACTLCSGGIVDKDKLAEVIYLQRKFISELDIDSVEY